MGQLIGAGVPCPRKPAGSVISSDSSFFPCEIVLAAFFAVAILVFPFVGKFRAAYDRRAEDYKA